MSDHIVVLVTAPSAERGREIGRALVAERLVACVNVSDGLTSIYTWEGKVCEESEALLVMKTRAALFDRLAERVVALHPYDVPEVVALPIAAGSAPYLDWIDASTM